MASNSTYRDRPHAQHIPPPLLILLFLLNPRLPLSRHPNHTHPTHPSATSNNASLFFVGTATTLLELENIRLMTGPNFVHAGDHVHLGPGVNATRLVLLSHYHGDHFDQDVETRLRRDLPIITTPHAMVHLAHKEVGEALSCVYELAAWRTMMVDVKAGYAKEGEVPAIKVTGMLGKHVDLGVLDIVNDIAKAIPPTNGWILELGYSFPNTSFKSGYRIYISGDTLFVDDLKRIPEVCKDQQIDLMLIHLGGTSIPSPNLPLLMVTMDAKQGLQLVQLIMPDLTIPIHFDDYDVFQSPLSNCKKVVEEAGMSEKVVYMDRKEADKFKAKRS